MFARPLVPALLLGLLLNGCAFVRVDPDGTKHVTGLVAMAIPPDNRGEQGRGSAFTVTSLGLSLLVSEQESGIALGYYSYGAIVPASTCGAPGTLIGNLESR